MRQEYPKIPLKIWLKVSKLPKSSYYEWVKKLKQKDEKEEKLIEEIKEIITKSKGTYGYRRVTIALRQKGKIVNHKKVLRLMKKYDLLCKKFTRRSRKYIAFRGETGKIAKNELNRNFKTNKPNEKWLTDITEFKIKNSNKKLYLSPIMDLYNGEIIAYSISTRPTLELAIEALDKALNTKEDLSKLTIHSDQGYHYQHISWVKRLEEKNITQSMSRRGNCIDNSPMENFFGILKQEMYYGEEYKSIRELKESIEEYIYWYNNERIKEKLNGMSPVKYRQHAA